jgi:uncharacterized protein (DUF433 family)
MLDTIERLGGWRTDAAYEIGEAHRLTGVSAASIKRWLRDYPSYIAELKPPCEQWLAPLFPNPLVLSFLELVEVLLAGKIRAGQRATYREVRKYHDAIAAEWGTQFPFAHENLLANQESLPAPAAKVLGQLDYEDGFASRWCPLGKDEPIAVDPQRGSGAPTIKGRRLRVEDIRGLFKAGEPISRIANDFDLETDQVEAALRYAFFMAT